MDTNKHGRIESGDAARRGFSMIEVLVAATLLVVIVMLLGMIFQQSSVAWRAGLLRSRGLTQLRGLVGAIQRDASGMIDANQLPVTMLQGGQEQKFSTSSILFYTATGTEEDRALRCIAYDTGSTPTRRSWRLDPPLNWQLESDVLLDFQTAGNDTDGNSTARIDEFLFAYQSGKQYDRTGGEVTSNSQKFPLFMTVRATLTQGGALYDVGAESWGPNGVEDPEGTDPRLADDIRTWAK
jgi:prepilin-type N-terminal cleavage/methylation domain-containing protein